MRYRALLLGNWEYQHLQPLRGPKTDVEVLRNALTHQEFGLFKNEDIVTPPPVNLTASGLAKEIEKFLNAAEKDDYLFIYYSGHGGLATGDYLALCGVDTESIDATAFETNKLPLWIQEKAHNVPTVVVLDCCFAGGAMANASKGTSLSLTEKNIPDGLFVLASSGRTTSPDAAADGEPSPFTDKLASILINPDIRGDDDGFLSGTRVFDELRKLLPQNPPRWKGEGNSPFRFARRPRPAITLPLPDWPSGQSVETIEIRFTANGTCIWSDTPADSPPQEVALEKFDQQRRWTIRRLTDLVDQLARQMRLDPESIDAVRKGWRCIGENLFTSLLPRGVQNRVRTADRSADTLLKLRLAFEDPQHALEFLPWEYLCEPLDRESEDEVNPVRPRTLGRSPGILIERASPPLTRTSNSERVWEVLIINAYRNALNFAGERVYTDLQKIFDPKVMKYIGGADARFDNTWDNLEHASRYLVLIAPLKRETVDSNQPRWTKIGLVRNDGEPDFRYAHELLQQLDRKKHVFDCIFLITYAAEPGRDSYRGCVALAARMASEGYGPVAFVCHEQAYLAYLGRETPAPTFTRLVIDALQQKKEIDQAVSWARDRVIRLAGDDGLSFGVPGLYARQRQAIARVTASQTTTGIGMAIPSLPLSDSSSQQRTSDTSASHVGKPSLPPKALGLE